MVKAVEDPDVIAAEVFVNGLVSWAFDKKGRIFLTNENALDVKMESKTLPHSK